jgi:hypothetical protein
MKTFLIQAIGFLAIPGEFLENDSNSGPARSLRGSGKYRYWYKDLGGADRYSILIIKLNLQCF